MSAATVTDTPAKAAGGAAPAASDAPMHMDDSAAPPPPADSPAVQVAEALGAMGFVDAELVQFCVEKNGPDLDACVRDLATLNEHEAALHDLAEMGFPNAKLNAKLLIKNGGCVKNCVRDLVADM